MSQKRYGEIGRKLEDACEDHIQRSTTELITDVQILKGLDTTEVASERIEIVSEDQQQEILGATQTGNWNCNLTIRYCYNYSDVTRADAQAKASELFDLFLGAGINNELNAHSQVEDFWVYGGSTTEGEGRGAGFEVVSIRPEIIDEHTLAMTMTATVYCRPSPGEIPT